MARHHRQISGIFKSDDVQGLQRYEGAVAALRDAGMNGILISVISTSGLVFRIS